MTPAEHRAEAESLIEFAADGDRDLPAAVRDSLTRLAQVHATLALAPPPPPEKPQQKWSLDKAQQFPDATGGFLVLTPIPDGLIFNFEDTALLMEHPAVLRTIASVLTAHADRLENR